MATLIDLNAEAKAEMLAQIERLTAENARLKANGKGTHGVKVSAKGAVSVYGLGRFPVTLYASQWHALFSKANEINEFIHAHKAELAVKE